LTACPASITPGAVVFYLPNGSCLNNTSSGDTFVFSGYQYNWVVVYEPGTLNPPANTCSNFIGALENSAFIGLVYVPSASLSVSGGSGFNSRGTGGLIADTISFSGSLPSIVYGSSYAPGPPATRLVG
jgi:hypothetical protein